MNRMTEKIVEYGGVQYTAFRRTNYLKQDVTYFRRVIAILHEDLIKELKLDAQKAIPALVDFANISALCTGGAVLMDRYDAPEVLQEKCRQWLTNEALTELGDLLEKAVNEVNASNPDRALAPDPLPDSADPKASSAVKNSRKRRAPTG